MRILGLHDVTGSIKGDLVAEFLGRVAGAEEFKLWPVAMSGTLTYRSDAMVVVADARLEHRHLVAESLDVPSDTSAPALIAHAWARWGPISLERLEGEFAFAIFDGTLGELVLARDALGRRPLHFARQGEVVAFASTPMPLARLRRHVCADIDRLAGYVAHLPESGPRSFFEGVSRVMPGHLVTVGADGTLSQTRWWNPSFKTRRLAFADAVRAVQFELDRAIVGAVQDAPEPLAAQLSGGLDGAP